MITVGVDIAKQTHSFAILSKSGAELVSPMVIPNNKLGFEELNRLIQLHSEEGKRTIKIAMEDTGHYSANLEAFLEEKGYPVYKYNPLLIKEYAKSLSLRKTKTDKADAITIARKILSDTDKKIPLIPKEMVELKCLSRFQTQITGKCSSTMVQYSATLDRLFPEIAHGEDGLRYSKYILEILKRYPSAFKIAKARVSTLDKFIPKGVTKFTGESLKQLAKESVGVSDEIQEFILVQQIHQMEFFEQEKKVVKKKISQLLKKVDSQITTIPGVSDRLGSIILSEIGDINNFDNPGKLLAFAGLEPSISQSGKADNPGKMVKRGSTHLRWALIQASEKIINLSEHFHAYYIKKREKENKEYNVALSHVARKLVRLIWKILKDGCPYLEQGA